MKNIGFIFVLATLLSLASCGKSGSGSPDTGGTTPPVTTIGVSANFAKGADASWITQMKASNYKFYNSAGTQQDVLQLLKDKGINSIRLRVWVNPTDGWCSKADLLAK